MKEFYLKVLKKGNYIRFDSYEDYDDFVMYLKELGYMWGETTRISRKKNKTYWDNNYGSNTSIRLNDNGEGILYGDYKTPYYTDRDIVLYSNKKNNINQW